MLVVLCGCGVSGSFVRSSVVQDRIEPAADQIDTRILLIGDAGEPQLDGPEPVFVALAARAAELPERTWVIFLGDNIYPKGLPPSGDPGRALAEQRLRAAIDALSPSGAEIVFVPGNHDWYFDGWAGVRRQAEFVQALGNPHLRVLPANGCPGPEIVDTGTRARLVFLDSQWWLSGGDKPRDPSSACPQDSDREIVAVTRHALQTAGERRVVVLAHHPLATHGPHGGHFTWRQHLFPLVDASRWAWVPLPLLGSLYPIARTSGITAQDLSSGEYQHWNAALRGAFEGNLPLLIAAGHEHTLQILEPADVGVQLVSGAGTVSRPSGVGRGSDTLYASAAAGFAQLDLLRDGRARLEVFEVAADGRVTRPVALQLPVAAR
jgi:hypothetical protein